MRSSSAAHNSASALSVDEDNSCSKASWNRIPNVLIFFEVVVCLYAVFNGVLVYFFTDASLAPGMQFTCTTSQSDFLIELLTYFIPFFLPILFMLVCNAVVLYRLFTLLSRRDSFAYENEMRMRQSSQGELLTETSSSHPCISRFLDGMSRLDEPSRATAMRTILLPLFYMLNPIAGSMMVFLPVSESFFLMVLVNSTVGIFNCILWVGVDRPVLRMWQRHIRRWCGCHNKNAPTDETGSEFDSDLLTDIGQSHHCHPEMITNSL